jgi:hypothetical protein
LAGGPQVEGLQQLVVDAHGQARFAGADRWRVLVFQVYRHTATAPGEQVRWNPQVDPQQIGLVAEGLQLLGGGDQFAEFHRPVQTHPVGRIVGLARGIAPDVADQGRGSGQDGTAERHGLCRLLQILAVATENQQ